MKSIIYILNLPLMTFLQNVSFCSFISNYRRKKIVIAVASLMLIIFSNCSTIMPPGLFYSSVSYTGQILPHEKLGDKKGVSCAGNYLWLYAFGDLSVKNAATSVGIKKINLVEYETSNFLIFYTYNCIIVYGE